MSEVMSCDLVPPCLLMLATVVLLSIKNRILLFFQLFTSCLIVSRTASISSQLMWRSSWLPRHRPARVLPSKVAPQPCLEASDVTTTSGGGRVKGAPTSKLSGTLHHLKSIEASSWMVTQRGPLPYFFK